jgi:hypothetical protein
MSSHNRKDDDAKGTRRNEDGFTNTGFFNDDEPKGATASPISSDGVFFIGDSPVLQRKVGSDETGDAFESSTNDKQGSEFTVIDPITVLPEEDVPVDEAYACSKPPLAAEVKEGDNKKTDIAAREKYQKPPMASSADDSRNGKKSKQKKLKKTDLKKEVDMDEHQISMDELESRLQTDFDKGLTSAEARARLERDGLNALTPQKETPMIMKFVVNLFGGFAVLLWIGAVLALIGYGIGFSTSDNPPIDNLALAIVLISVVVVTGLFSFYQEYSSDKVMDSFKKMVPQVSQFLKTYYLCSMLR